MTGTKDTEARIFGDYHIRCPADKCLLKENTELLKVFEQGYNKTSVLFGGKVIWQSLV